jgi:DNA polymerase-3 subunit beta
MKFTTDKKDFMAALGACLKVMDAHTSMPILSHALIEADDDGLTLSGTDLELAVRVHCDAEVREVGSAAMPARKLYDYLGAIAAGAEVTIALDEPGGWAKATCAKTRVKVPTLKAESWPDLPKAPEPAFSIDREVLKGLIRRVGFAMSDGANKSFELHGAALQIRGEALSMVATDYHRLSLAAAPIAAPVCSVFIPAPAIGQLKQLCEKGDAPIGISENENHIFAASDGTLIICRKVAVKFPDYERTLSRAIRNPATVNRLELRDALAAAGVFSEQETRLGPAHKVALTFKGAELTVQSTSAMTGEAETCISYTGEERELVIGMNARFILDFLDAVDSEEIEIRTDTANGPMEFNVPGDASYRYIAMPMHI